MSKQLFDIGQKLATKYLGIPAEVTNVKTFAENGGEYYRYEITRLSGNQFVRWMTYDDIVKDYVIQL